MQLKASSDTTTGPWSSGVGRKFWPSFATTAALPPVSPKGLGPPCKVFHSEPLPSVSPFPSSTAPLWQALVPPVAPLDPCVGAVPQGRPALSSGTAFCLEGLGRVMPPFGPRPAWGEYSSANADCPREPLLAGLVDGSTAGTQLCRQGAVLPCLARF